MAGTFAKINQQYVFAVQERHSLIPEQHKEELHKYLTSLAQARKATMLAVHCMPDHTHLFVGIKPAISIPYFVKEIKVESNAFIRSKRWVKGEFYWQEGYSMFSCCHLQVDRVCKYVLNQEEHHRKKTFQEEYPDLRRKFTVPYEGRFLFEWILQEETVPSWRSCILPAVQPALR